MSWRRQRFVIPTSPPVQRSHGHLVHRTPGIRPPVPNRILYSKACSAEMWPDFLVSASIKCRTVRSVSIISRLASIRRQARAPGSASSCRSKTTTSGSAASGRPFDDAWSRRRSGDTITLRDGQTPSQPGAGPLPIWGGLGGQHQRVVVALIIVAIILVATRSTSWAH